MEFQSIEKKQQGQFIHRYDLTYKTVDGKEKVYEVISRDKNIETLSDIQNKEPDAVVMIMHNANKDKILLNREYRMAVGDWVYNFPAGLLEEGETPEIGGARELKEETGLTLISVEDTIPLSYSAVGFSNEKNVCIVGVADGEFAKSTSTLEEIESAWYTKEEVKELLQSELFAARTQAYCYLWCRQ